MPVFISHRTADDSIAQQVAFRLRHRHGIAVYIDDIDQQVSRTRGTPAITALLVRRVNECTNLLAIVTQNTRGSWWVPFEIGIARQAPRVITSFTNQADASLPEYLWDAPNIKNVSTVDTFARLYKQQQKVLTEQVLEKRASASTQVSYVDQFHTALKAALGQR